MTSQFPLVAFHRYVFPVTSISVVAYARWEKDGVMIKQVELYQDENSRVSIDEFHTLHIQNVEKEDEGEYTCWHNSVQHLDYKIIREYRSNGEVSFIMRCSISVTIVG